MGGVARAANRSEIAAYVASLIGEMRPSGGIEINYTYIWMRIWCVYLALLQLELYGGACGAAIGAVGSVFSASSYLNNVLPILGGLRGGTDVLVELTSMEFADVGGAIHAFKEWRTLACRILWSQVIIRLVMVSCWPRQVKFRFRHSASGSRCSAGARSECRRRRRQMFLWKR